MQDYTLDQYLRVLAEVPLPDGRVIYLRSLSDNEMKLRQKAAMLASRNKRIELRDESSAAFLEFIAPIEEEEDENIIRSILHMSRPDFAEEARDRYPLVHLPYPDDAKLEERVDIDERRIEHRRDIMDKRQEYVESREAAYGEKVRGWSRDSIVGACKEKVTTTHLMAAYIEESERQLVLLGTYSDEDRTIPFFPSTTDIGNFNRAAYRAVYAKLEEINEVDIFTIEGFSSTES